MATEPGRDIEIDIGQRVDWSLPLATGTIRAHLDDGTAILVRPIREGDAPALRHAFTEMSPRSRYLRFFTVREELSHELTEKLTDIDHDRHRAWVVADPSARSAVGTPEGRGIAVARIIVVEDDPKVAEAAIAVIDDYQGRGVGRLLLQLLLATAHAIDVAYLRFETLAENRPIRSLLSSVNAEKNPNLSDGEVLVYDLPVGSEISESDRSIGALYAILRFIATPE